MNKTIRSIGVLTSGGDSPGMNAAIRAVVRAGAFYKLKTFGIYEGYQGLIENNIHELTARTVKNILNRGGTVLKSSRSEEFRTEEGRKKAHQNLKEQNIDALVIIGGDGTFTGGHIFSQEFDLPIIGIPGTIDNDLYGTDYTIGFDTATNVVVECIDKIRDTAESHNRLFFVEVMGRDSGFIALRSALASGALDVVLPEENAPMEDLFNELEKSEANQKTNKLVVVAEGNELGDTFKIAEQVKNKFPHLESKVTILGHLQRGGSPSCLDRVLASQLGVAAIEGLLAGKSKIMAGLIDNKIVFTSFEEAINGKVPINKELIRISKILSI
ncbi:6-phosphofructokinase [Owenweeksia hongkongensis]|uniref:ATP-dependent 6-phosphofructokinase n=1 Tax=Owenweeksia hongkongensis (strain DSM 17368 / CIP 108786 / JCM 12287 / NRRL B-23963 / UST20020801) TaxID=926562 RepID=G8R6Z3_OWEHD|nr:6-phosphofructokinase [Owenweeksia hongkongensis]AEV32328.1 6-phosphofructokinase [Owenweeksia hongkongensis DSM 17368]